MKIDTRTKAAIAAGHPEWAELPATRKDALEAGAKVYFTGKACKHQHVDFRWITSGCATCNRAYYAANADERREYQRTRRQNPDVKVNERAQQCERRQDPKVKAKLREYERERRQDPEYKAMQRERYQDPEVKAKLRKYQRERYQAPEVKAKQREYERKRRQNPQFVADVNAKKAKRHAAKKRATWPHETPLMREQMKMVYAWAKRLTEWTCVEWQVDHIVPLTHDDVQGYHVIWNLQLLTKGENCSKSNSFDGTMDNDGWRERL